MNEYTTLPSFTTSQRFDEPVTDNVPYCNALGLIFYSIYILFSYVPSGTYSQFLSVMSLAKTLSLGKGKPQGGFSFSGNFETEQLFE